MLVGSVTCFAPKGNFQRGDTWSWGEASASQVQVPYAEAAVSRGTR